MQLTDSVTVLGGVFNGSPIPRNSPNTPTSNPHGVSFPLDTGMFAIAELQYALGSNASGKAANDGPLPGNYKLGAWYDSYKFDDQQTDNEGIPLASPLSNGIPAAHHGNFSLYGVADQMIWRSKDDANRTLNVFVRPMFTPYQDRNLVSASINAGWLCTLRSRGATTTLSASKWGPPGPAAAPPVSTDKCNSSNPRSIRPFGQRDRSRGDLPGSVLPSWQLQPDVQYFINPGLGIANPNEPTQRIKNEFVVGLRTNITF